jgi:hypothetical protein
MRRRILITMAAGIQWELTDARFVAGLHLTQAFKQSGKTQRLLQEQRTGRQFHIRQALGAAGRRAGGNGHSSMKD